MAEELGEKIWDLCKNGRRDSNLSEVRELLEGTPENIRAEVLNYRGVVSRLGEIHPWDTSLLIMNLIHIL